LENQTNKLEKKREREREKKGKGRKENGIK
jgi:hypothetical protein